MDRYELKRITQGKYRKFKRNWKCFIQYLVKNYLCDNSKFPHSRWNYHFSILYDHDPSITTNPLENINLKLKKLVGCGYLSRTNAYKKVKKFHLDQISLYTQDVVGNKMSKIKPKYLNREKNLIAALELFENLSHEDQFLNLVYYCTEFGCYTSDLDAIDFGKEFQKVPEPNLEEIQEIESASFLIFREILCQ